MNFDFDNNIPIYIQLVEQIKINIISGAIKSGERLLSVRELALKYKVNPNTVQRALMELENAGLIYTERTNGKFVTNDKELIQKHKMDYALSTKYLNSMKNIGFLKNDSINYLNEMEEKE